MRFRPGLPAQFAIRAEVDAAPLRTALAVAEGRQDTAWPAKTLKVGLSACQRQGKRPQRNGPGGAGSRRSENTKAVMLLTAVADGRVLVEAAGTPGVLRTARFGAGATVPPPPARCRR